jgi:hypothetical protein
MSLTVWLRRLKMSCRVMSMRRGLVSIEEAFSLFLENVDNVAESVAAIEMLIVQLPQLSREEADEKDQGLNSNTDKEGGQMERSRDETEDEQTDDEQTDDEQTDDEQTDDEQTDDEQTDDEQTDDEQTSDEVYLMTKTDPSANVVLRWSSPHFRSTRPTSSISTTNEKRYRSASSSRYHSFSLRTQTHEGPAEHRITVCCFQQPKLNSTSVK